MLDIQEAGEQTWISRTAGGERHLSIWLQGKQQSVQLGFYDGELSTVVN